MDSVQKSQQNISINKPRAPQPGNSTQAMGRDITTDPELKNANIKTATARFATCQICFDPIDLQARTRNIIACEGKHIYHLKCIMNQLNVSHKESVLESPCFICATKMLSQPWDGPVAACKIAKMGNASKPNK